MNNLMMINLFFCLENLNHCFLIQIIVIVLSEGFCFTVGLLTELEMCLDLIYRFYLNSKFHSFLFLLS